MTITASGITNTVPLSGTGVAPGPILTDMMKEETEEWKAKKLSELPIGRFGIAMPPPGNLCLSAECLGRTASGFIRSEHRYRTVGAGDLVAVNVAEE